MAGAPTRLLCQLLTCSWTKRTLRIKRGWKDTTAGTYLESGMAASGERKDGGESPQVLPMGVADTELETVSVAAQAEKFGAPARD